VTCVAEDTQRKEIYRSKQQLQAKLLQLVAEEAEEIQAYNIVSGERMDFLVRKDIYSTKATKDNNSQCLSWYKDLREEYEDSEEVLF
jgi:hypothetical protein